jgi:hypothetical protein
MNKYNLFLNSKNHMHDWLTIEEAVQIANKETSLYIKDSDIYRHALYGNIYLSIYFQSPIILRKVKKSNNKIKLQHVKNSLIHRLCLVESKCFINQSSFITSTEGEYISPIEMVIDTNLSGHEYIMIQRLLSHSLNIPLPVKGASDINYGISVIYSGDIFQVFEKITWKERIKNQIIRLPKNITQELNEDVFSKYIEDIYQKEYFPIHDLPPDACFVIRHTELDKLVNMYLKNNNFTISSPRISTPLSRLFWLACKYNETISPLITQPYKLLSIFEQWASDEGITERLSGDTLKAALKRGSPMSISVSKK